MFGVLAAVLGVLPLLAAGGLVFSAVKNHRIQTGNDAFIPAAWHNLRTDEIFPDLLRDPAAGAGQSTGWLRQGIAEQSGCKEALVERLAEVAVAQGCTAVLRATYVDAGGEAAATIALCVLGSNDQALAIERSGFSVVADRPGPMVVPVAVPKTAAAGWRTKLGYGGGTDSPTLFGPYLAAITVGPTDPDRRYGDLPAGWTATEEQELRIYQTLAMDLLGAYSRSFDRAVNGR
ncbi:hypothetical protein [Plantactinospora endophytica]|uniref:Secreted protein n=1 Tax=Plantactinospora endophytica TaxID=673535 RepID=A0ABQ4EC60_9ACTN|nr:hypothetical protein [Plantactinospora endophytica]GIG92279.1 hypothetical protein Pen02_72150 [Plantactinospora endophytica]